MIRGQTDHQLDRARATACRLGGTQSTRIRPVIEGVATALRRLHRNPLVSIETGMAEFYASVARGPKDLQDVLGNMIDHATNRAKARAVISVALRADGKLRIRIADDGPGMPPDAHEPAFRPGERLDESTPGSGLCLAIARDVVGLNDGRL